MRRRAFGHAGLVAAVVVAWCIWPASAQQGGQQGSGGAPLGNLIPPDIDLILAYPPDNSLIVRDPPIEDPNAKSVLLVKAQWLEVVRIGANNTVRRFRALESPEATLTSGAMGEVKVKTPIQTVTYPIRVTLEPGNVVSMLLYSAAEPGKVQYRLDKKEGVQLGESYVVSGLISPQNDGQRETYLQFTFNLKPKDGNAKADSKDGNGRPAPPGGK